MLSPSGGDEENNEEYHREYERSINHLINEQADKDVFNKTFGECDDLDSCSSSEASPIRGALGVQSDYSRTGIVFNEDNVKHYCLWDENYEENPKRFIAIVDRMREWELIEKCQQISPRKGTESEVLLVHTPEYLEKLKKTAHMSDDDLEKHSSKYDAVYFNNSTYEAALFSVGSTIDMAEAVVTGQFSNGFALIRPPGHHAMASEACGYCFFNNVAIAAEHCRKNLGLERILIVDWDVHHGQATQQKFYNNSQVLYASLHRYEFGTFWPELIESNYNFTGGDQARGFNVNIPLNDIYLTDSDYLAIWHNVLLPIFYEFDPQFILVSAGYDAAIGCPEGEMLLTPSFYAHATHSLMALAGGKVCVVLEGGYCVDSLADGAACTLKALLGHAPAPIRMKYPINESVVHSILDATSVLRTHWKFLRMQQTFNRNDSDNEAEFLRRRRYKPMIEYRGTVGFLTQKPEAYPTRNCYPVQDDETKERYSKKIAILRQYVIQKNNIYDNGKRTCLVTIPDFGKRHAAYSTHPERPNRLRLLKKLLKKEGILQRCYMLNENSRTATENELLMCHTPEALQNVKKAANMKHRELREHEQQFDSVYFCRETYEVACQAVGSLLQVIDTVLTNESRNGFACIRPPGHHASQDNPAGFCFFNNVAIAAHYAIKKFKLNRILIVDWDIHHGDGTQRLCLDNENILFVSLHRYDNAEFWPGNLEANFTIGKNVINIPWVGGPMGDKEYLAAFFNIILPLAYNFDPELVLVSAGFDSAEGDPIGEYRLTPRVYGHLTHMLSGLANGKLVMALEGGYNLEVVANSAYECIRVLLGDPPKFLNLTDDPINECAIETIANVIDYHASNWPSLAFNVDIAESNF